MLSLILVYAATTVLAELARWLRDRSRERLIEAIARALPRGGHARGPRPGGDHPNRALRGTAAPSTQVDGAVNRRDPDRAGFEEFFDQTHGRYVVAVTHIVGDRAVAEDLVDDAYLRSYRGWERIENPHTWISAVIYRDAARHRPTRAAWQRL